MAIQIIQATPASVSYHRFDSKHTSSLPFSQFARNIPSISLDLPLTLPPLATNRQSQCSISSRESIPALQHGQLPSPTPSDFSRSLSPPSMNLSSCEDSRRLKPFRRPPWPSWTRTLTPPPCTVDALAISSRGQGSVPTRTGSLQYNEQPPYSTSYHAGIRSFHSPPSSLAEASLLRPALGPRPEFLATEFTLQSNATGFPSSFISTPTFSPSHHFLCPPPYQTCRSADSAYQQCETTRWLYFMARFSRLPPNVLLRVSRLIDYQRLLCLRQLNRSLWTNIDPQQAPYDSKVAFVKYIETALPKHWPIQKRKSQKATQGEQAIETEGLDAEAAGRKRATGRAKRRKRTKLDLPGDFDDDENTEADKVHNPGNFGCYLDCFKVLGPENFECFQWTSRDLVQGSGASQLRRYCIRCGVKYGLYKPGDYITRHAGVRVWVCGCLQIHEYGSITCSDCGSYCPFSGRDR